MSEIISELLAVLPGQAVAVELQEPSTSAITWTVILEGLAPGGPEEWVSVGRPVVTRAPGSASPGRRLVALGLVPGFSTYRARATPSAGSPTGVTLRLQAWTGVIPGGATAGLLNLDDPPSIAPPQYVVSFNGRSGVVTSQAGDYNAGQVGAVPASSVGQSGGVAPLDGSAQITDATHGARAGGTLHAAATPSTPGFLTGPDKAKLDRQATVQNALIVKCPAAGDAQTTRAPGAVFEGCVFEVPAPCTVSTLYGRLTALTTLGAGLQVAIYQVPGGQLDGTAVLLGSALVAPGVTGAQQITAALGSIDLAPGVAFVLFGRSSATLGITLRTWSVGTIDGLTSVVPSGQTPLCFSTTFPSLLPDAPPPSFLTSALLPSTSSPAWLGRIA